MWWSGEGEGFTWWSGEGEGLRWRSGEDGASGGGSANVVWRTQAMVEEELLPSLPSLIPSSLLTSAWIPFQGK
ncbi:hypothetical protein MA16_Dca010903 [Dendrobium catenatum]|uniref:Uncharacterized protein n=1 Tax=Dendrobium catenatum TaxID=906689 RepID=A0A2I0X7E6_9ASPA|nr:hypothetical protein MA16_Dca010903 [Dendrobium catenatum]